MRLFTTYRLKGDWNGLTKERAKAGFQLNRLIFGERYAAFDFHYEEEIAAWLKRGILPHLDRCFSCDQELRRYVQDRIRGREELLVQ